MKAIVMGRSINYDGYEEGDFFSTIAFLDYELVVLDLGSILSKYLRDATKYGESTSLTYQNGTYLLQTLIKRSQEFLDYLKHGRPAVIIATDLGRFQWINRSGGNFENGDAGQFFPGCGSKSVAQSGSAIEFCGPPVAREFAQIIQPVLFYTAVLTDQSDAKPLFQIKGTKKTIGHYYDTDNAWLLVIPAFPADSTDADIQFGSAIEALRQAREATKLSFQLPVWHARFTLPTEQTLQLQAEELERMLREHNSKIEDNKIAIQKLERLKGLFTENGRNLVEIVQSALEDLGFLVEHGPEGQDDLIAKYGDQVAVIEVKGRDNSSAAERDAAQLEKWSSRYFEENGEEPKAILIVNGYRNLPLDERDSAVFPDQMLKYATRKEQCLISGVQLLCLTLSANSKERKAAAIRKLLDTTGVFPEYVADGWKKVIQVSS